MTIGNL